MARRVQFGENAEEDREFGVAQGELTLVEKAYIYFTENRYLADCSKNDKRSIRRKAERLVERNGELFYINRGGGELMSCVANSIPSK